MSRSKFTTSLAVAFGLVALPSLAAASGPPTAMVSYSDLDLGSPAGVAALNGRIRRAAEALCASERSGPGYWAILRARQCVRSATASAAPQVAQAVSEANATRYASRSRIIVSGR